VRDRRREEDTGERGEEGTETREIKRKRTRAGRDRKGYGG
jgi:hypothetical protein